MEIAIGQLDQAQAGMGTTVLISGDPGIGKTRLLQEMIKKASGQGFTCLIGRSRGHDQDPLIAIKEIAVELQRMGKLSTDLDPSSLDWEDFKGRIIHGLLALAHDSPLLVALEDLQWADTGTLNLFHSLGRRVAGSRMVLVGTYRQDEVDEQLLEGNSPLMDVKRALERQGLLVSLVLDPLPDEGIVKIANGYLGFESDVKVLDVVVERSMGNPLFALENIKLMRETQAIYKLGTRWSLDHTRHLPLAPGMKNVVMRRLEQLPVQHRKVLGILSVIGQSFPTSLASIVLAKCSRGENGPGMLQIPIDLAMVWNDGVKMGFEHEEVRRAIYVDLKDKSRRTLHHVVAMSMLDLDREQATCSVLSFHFFNANDWKESMVFSLEAARESLKKQAQREASEFYERALRSAEHLDVGEREKYLPEIFENLGDLNLNFCRFDASISCFEEARKLVDDNEAQARLLRKMSVPWANRDDFANLSQPIQLLDQASRLEGVSEAEQNEITGYRAALYFYQRDYEEAIRLTQKTRDWYVRHGDQGCVFWETVHISMYLLNLGRIDEAWEELESARALITAGTKSEALAEYYPQRAELLMIRGHYDSSLETLERSIEHDDATGLYTNLSNDQWMAGLVWDLKGRHDKALERAEQAVKYAMIDEMRRAVIRSNALLAHEHIVLGDLRAAESALEKNSLLAEEEGLSAKAVGTGLFWVAMAELHLIKGAKDLSDDELNNGLSIIDKNEQGLFFSALARLWFGSTLKRIGRTQEALPFLEDAAQRFTDLSNLDQARTIEAFILDL